MFTYLLGCPFPRRLLPPVSLPLLSDRLHPSVVPDDGAHDLVVEDEDDHAGDVERRQRGDDDEVRVVELALGLKSVGQTFIPALKASSVSLQLPCPCPVRRPAWRSGRGRWARRRP